MYNTKKKYNDLLSNLAYVLKSSEDRNVINRVIQWMNTLSNDETSINTVEKEILEFFEKNQNIDGSPQNIVNTGYFSLQMNQNNKTLFFSSNMFYVLYSFKILIQRLTKLKIEGDLCPIGIDPIIFVGKFQDYNRIELPNLDILRQISNHSNIWRIDSYSEYEFINNDILNILYKNSKNDAYKNTWLENEMNELTKKDVKITYSVMLDDDLLDEKGEVIEDFSKELKKYMTNKECENNLIRDKNNNDNNLNDNGNNDTINNNNTCDGVETFYSDSGTIKTCCLQLNELERKFEEENLKKPFNVNDNSKSKEEMIKDYQQFYFDLLGETFERIQSRNKKLHDILVTIAPLTQNNDNLKNKTNELFERVLELKDKFARVIGQNEQSPMTDIKNQKSIIQFYLDNDQSFENIYQNYEEIIRNKPKSFIEKLKGTTESIFEKCSNLVKKAVNWVIDLKKIGLSMMKTIQLVKGLYSIFLKYFKVSKIWDLISSCYNILVTLCSHSNFSKIILNFVLSLVQMIPFNKIASIASKSVNGVLQFLTNLSKEQKEQIKLDAQIVIVENREDILNNGKSTIQKIDTPKNQEIIEKEIKTLEHEIKDKLNIDEIIKKIKTSKKYVMKTFLIFYVCLKFLFINVIGTFSHIIGYFKKKINNKNKENENYTNDFDDIKTQLENDEICYDLNKNTIIEHFNGTPIMVEVIHDEGNIFSKKHLNNFAISLGLIASGKISQPIISFTPIIYGLIKYFIRFPFTNDIKQNANNTNVGLIITPEQEEEIIQSDDNNNNE